MITAQIELTGQELSELCHAAYRQTAHYQELIKMVDDTSQDPDAHAAGYYRMMRDTNMKIYRKLERHNIELQKANR